MKKQAPITLERHTHVSDVTEIQIHYFCLHNVFQKDKPVCLHPINQSAVSAKVTGFLCESHYYQIGNKLLSICKMVSGYVAFNSST